MAGSLNKASSEKTKCLEDNLPGTIISPSNDMQQINSSLHTAILERKLSTVQELLCLSAGKLKELVLMKNSLMQTPFHCAVMSVISAQNVKEKNVALDVLALLLAQCDSNFGATEWGQLESICDQDGKTALDRALTCKDALALYVKQLDLYNIFLLIRFGETRECSFAQSPEKIIPYLQPLIDMRCVDRNGNTVLHLLAQARDNESPKILINILKTMPMQKREGFLSQKNNEGKTIEGLYPPLTLLNFGIPVATNPLEKVVAQLSVDMHRGFMDTFKNTVNTLEPNNVDKVCRMNMESGKTLFYYICEKTVWLEDPRWLPCVLSTFPEDWQLTRDHFINDQVVDLSLDETSQFDVLDFVRINNQMVPFYELFLKIFVDVAAYNFLSRLVDQQTLEKFKQVVRDNRADFEFYIHTIYWNNLEALKLLNDPKTPLKSILSPSKKRIGMFSSSTSDDFIKKIEARIKDLKHDERRNAMQERKVRLPNLSARMQ